MNFIPEINSYGHLFLYLIPTLNSEVPSDNTRTRVLLGNIDGAFEEIVDAFDINNTSYSGSVILDPGQYSFEVRVWAEDNQQEIENYPSLNDTLQSHVDFNLAGVSDDPPNPVPEPTTIILFGSGLIGLAGLRRKFNKS